MEVIMRELEKLGFSKLEGAAYTTLLQKGEMTGYQIAKYTNTARASIYTVLDSLYKKGIVSLIPGETNIYRAEPPEIVLENMKDNYIRAADFAKENLKKLATAKAEEKFINIEGYDNVVTKTKELISEAVCEIIMHTDFELNTFRKEFIEAKERGVRIVVFSWVKVDIGNLPIEFYTRNETVSSCDERRMMIISDFKKAMIAGNSNNKNYQREANVKENVMNNLIKSEFLGSFTENKLMVSLVTEHIHFDIYLLRLFDKYGKDLIDKEIQIGTIMERGEK